MIYAWRHVLRLGADGDTVSASGKAGALVRYLRERAGLSRRELAARCQAVTTSADWEMVWSADTIVNIEMARRGRRLALEELLILAEVFEQGPAEFLSASDLLSDFRSRFALGVPR